MPPPPAPETQHIIRYSAEMAVSNPIRAVASSSQSAVHIKQTPAPRPLDRKNKKKISNQKRPKLGTLSTHGTGTRPNAKALEYYSSYLMAKYPLGLLPTMRWGTLAMRDACSELGLEELNPTKEEIKIMTYRNSNIRKPWLDAARKYTPPFYKLWGVLNDKDTKLIALNKQNVQRLLSEALFAHGNHAVPTGDSPYMSQMFYALIKACAFRNRESCGVRHGGIWSHITLELLAFLATLVEKVLYEWSTGISIETPFIVERWRQTYTEHLDKLRQQHKMCAAAMDVHCKRLVTTARDALGSGPDLSERPKSGVTSTSIELWAQRYAPALLTESALSVSNSQNEPTQAFAQETDFEGDLPMDTIHTQLQADGDLNEGMESLEEILAGSQQMYQATRSSLLAPQAMQEVLSDMPTVHSPGSGSFPSRRMNESTNILPPAQAPLQNQINEDTQTESEHDSYIAPQHPSVPAQPKPINEDTQTESEPDSIYETLRPSQSISQVRPNPNAPTQALSPATSFDQTCSSWVAGWVGLRSISQDHAEEFEREYPEVPPVNTGISESL
ncbi:hypothetical protein FRC08_018361 [Ceratobasidium sp. 394]|nr:hypothetical protein FRC08_018361 [Ceratobasidium sp. 394]